MWYNYKIHKCEGCGKDFEYSADTVTFARGTECPYCKEEYIFNVMTITPKKKTT